MENEELAQVLSNAELDDNAKIDAIQKIIGAKYVSADILANERKKFKESLEGENKNDNIKVTKKGNIKTTNIGYFFDG